MKKYAAQTIHMNGSFRISRFYDSHEDCHRDFPEADAISPYINWKEHEQWSREKKGNYQYRQIEK